MPIAFYDNEFVDKNAISIGIADFGFTRGLTIFDLVRVYKGVPFCLHDHLLRFQSGAEALGLDLPLSLPDLTVKVQELCAQNKFAHSALKFYFTAGQAGRTPRGFAEDHEFTPHLIIFEDEIKPDHPEAPYGLEFYRRGQRVRIVPHERALPAIKSINYMQGFIAAQQAGPDWDDILFTHRNGYVTEATKSNVFCVIDGVLCTPDKDMLHGITRKVILELAHELDIPTAERTLMPADLAHATEAFTTGSIAEMVPIKQIDDHVFPTTMEGPVFSALRGAFSARLASLSE